MQDAAAIDAFVRVEPIPRLLLGVRFSYWLRNAEATSTDAITTLWGSVGWRVAAPLELHLGVSRAFATTAAATELPGSDNLQVFGVTRVVF